MKLLLVVIGTVLMAGTARAQCGKLVLNPLTGLFDCIGSSSGGGGTGSAAAAHSVSFSATPTLTGTSATAGTVDTFIVGQLSANITGVTLATLTPGQVINIDFQQAASGGPYTVTYGGSFVGACAVSPFPSSHTKSTWYISAGPTATLTAGGCNADSGPNYSATLARSGIATPASGVAQGTDSSSNIPFSLDTAGVFRTEVKELTGIRQGNGANADDTSATQNQLSAPGYVAGGGSANAQTATLVPAVSTCPAGMIVRWKPTAANTTTTPTLAVGSCSAATIVKSPGNAALAANDLTTGAVATAVFDGTNWELQNPQTASGSGAGVTSVGGLTGVVPGGMILQEQHTASNSAEIDFTSCISATYDDYVIRISGEYSGTATNGLQMQMSTNGGSSYDTGSNYEWARFGWEATSSGTGPVGGGTTGYISVTLGDGSSTHTQNGTIQLANPGSSSAYKSVYEAFSGWSTTDTAIYGQITSAEYQVATAVNAFRFIPAAGNIAAGVFRCYGIAKQ